MGKKTIITIEKVDPQSSGGLGWVVLLIVLALAGIFFVLKRPPAEVSGIPGPPPTVGTTVTPPKVEKSGVPPPVEESGGPVIPPKILPTDPLNYNR